MVDETVVIISVSVALILVFLCGIVVCVWAYICCGQESRDIYSSEAASMRKTSSQQKPLYRPKYSTASRGPPINDTVVPITSRWSYAGDLPRSLSPIHLQPPLRGSNKRLPFHSDSDISFNKHFTLNVTPTERDSEHLELDENLFEPIDTTLQDILEYKESPILSYQPMSNKRRRSGRHENSNEVLEHLKHLTSSESTQDHDIRLTESDHNIDSYKDSDQEVIHSDQEVTDSDQEVIHSDQEVIHSDQEVIHSDQEVRDCDHQEVTEEVTDGGEGRSQEDEELLTDIDHDNKHENVMENKQHELHYRDEHITPVPHRPTLGLSPLAMTSYTAPIPPPLILYDSSSEYDSDDSDDVMIQPLVQETVKVAPPVAKRKVTPVPPSPVPPSSNDILTKRNKPHLMTMIFEEEEEEEEDN